jgi:hypothetical protein
MDPRMKKLIGVVAVAASVVVISVAVLPRAEPALSAKAMPSGLADDDMGFGPELATESLADDDTLTGPAEPPKAELAKPAAKPAIAKTAAKAPSAKKGAKAKGRKGKAGKKTAPKHVKKAKKKVAKKKAKGSPAA